LTPDTTVSIICKKGEDMNIYAKTGTPVTYIGVDQHQINWGSCDDPRDILELNKEYTIEYTDVYSWHTKVKLMGIEGDFPSVAFEE
jgi:hypothetical protein